MLFFRYCLTALLVFFLSGMLGFAILMAILREISPFFDSLSMLTKARFAYSITVICCFVLAAYDALSRIHGNPWTDKALAIINVICAIVGASIASTLASMLQVLPIIGASFKPPMQLIWAAAAGSAIHLYGFWGVERFPHRSSTPRPSQRLPWDRV